MTDDSRSAGEEFLVSTWTMPSDNAGLRTGVWRLRLGEQPELEPIAPTERAIYWATPEPGAASMLLLSNDEARSAMMRMSFRPDGFVTLSDRWSSGGEGGSYLSFHPRSEFFVVANSGAGWTLFRNGDRPEAIQTISNSGSGPHPRQSGSHPHCAVFSADGTWLYLADMGTDEILATRFDETIGALGEVVRAHRATPGSGPRHLVVGDRVLYALNELGNTLEVLAPDDAGQLRSIQILPTVPAGFSGETHAGHIGLSPDRRHLYATNRQHDSISVFEVVDGGLLDERASVSSGGSWPWCFAFTADGRRMIVANNLSDNLAVFDRGSDGGLTHASTLPLQRPVFITHVP